MAIQNIAVSALHQKLKKGEQVALIDVVSPAGFAASHVAGALNFPLKTLDPAAVMRFRGDASSTPLYIICQVGISSRAACEQFIAAGFDNVINVEGGKTAWEKAGLPLVRHPKPVLAEPRFRLLCAAAVLFGVLFAVLAHPVFLILPLAAGGFLFFSGISRR